MPTRTFLLLMLILLSVVAPTWAQDESPAKSGGSQKAERKIPRTKSSCHNPAARRHVVEAGTALGRFQAIGSTRSTGVFASESASSSDWQMSFPN